MFERAGLTVRGARAAEAAALTALCRRSKAHWGYDAAFMAMSAAGLTVSEDSITAGRVLVAEAHDGRVLGVAAVDPQGAIADLDLLFVDPPAMGRGAGRALFKASCALARDGGARALTILADPNAAPFYERMGARFVRNAPSDSIPGRELPFYVLVLEEAA